MKSSIGVVLGSASRQAGGLFTSVRRLSQVVDAKGMSVCVHALRDSDSERDSAAWGGLSLRLYDSVGPKQLGFVPELKRALRSEGHDLTHQHGIWQGFSGSVNAWGRKLDRPVVISPRGMLDPWALANASWKKKIAGWLYENANLRQSSCLHALNDSERISMRQMGLRNPIAVIPNGVDRVEAIPPGVPAPWKDQIPDGANVLLFLGRIHPKKGIDLLIRAIGQCRNTEAPNWHLVVAGWDQNGHLSELLALTESLSLSSNVHFVGPLFGEKKSAAFHHANAFTLPSHSEGLPMAVLEAWSNELPVLMTKACNLPEGANAGAAIEVETSVEALREGFTKLASLSDAELSEMGSAGKKLALEVFSWDLIGQKMSETYKWLLSGGPSPSFVEIDDA